MLQSYHVVIESKLGKVMHVIASCRVVAKSPEESVCVLYLYRRPACYDQHNNHHNTGQL